MKRSGILELIALIIFLIAAFGVAVFGAGLHLDLTALGLAVLTVAFLSKDRGQ